jgi:hypothetical protein
MPNSKKKGNRGENQLVHILEEAFGEGQFKRTPSSGAYTGGKNREVAENLPWEAKITLVSDIITPSDFNFVLEHKFYAEANFWDLFSDKSNWNEWITQVQDDAKFVNKVPLLVIKYNRHKRIALIPYITLLSYGINKGSEGYELQKIDTELIEKINLIAKKFIWRGYSVVELEDLLSLPKDFWFKQESIDDQEQ